MKSRNLIDKLNRQKEKKAAKKAAKKLTEAIKDETCELTPNEVRRCVGLKDIIPETKEPLYKWEFSDKPIYEWKKVNPDLNYKVMKYPTCILPEHVRQISYEELCAAREDQDEVVRSVCNECWNTFKKWIDENHPGEEHLWEPNFELDGDHYYLVVRPSVRLVQNYLDLTIGEKVTEAYIDDATEDIKKVDDELLERIAAKNEEIGLSNVMSKEECERAIKRANVDDKPGIGGCHLVDEAALKEVKEKIEKELSFDFNINPYIPGDSTVKPYIPGDFTVKPFPDDYILDDKRITYKFKYDFKDSSDENIKSLFETEPSDEVTMMMSVDRKHEYDNIIKNYIHLLTEAWNENDKLKEKVKKQKTKLKRASEDRKKLMSEHTKQIVNLAREIKTYKDCYAALADENYKLRKEIDMNNDGTGLYIKSLEDEIERLEEELNKLKTAIDIIL